MIGEVVSHYTILSRLGEGGMGVVYKAEDTRLKRTVALKLLPLEFTHDQTARERFFHESQAASALEHANICSVHELGEHDGRTFLVMGFYEGKTLKQKIERHAMFPLPRRQQGRLEILRHHLEKANGAGCTRITGTSRCAGVGRASLLPNNEELEH